MQMQLHPIHQQSSLVLPNSQLREKVSNTLLIVSNPEQSDDEMMKKADDQKRQCLG